MIYSQNIILIFPSKYNVISGAIAKCALLFTIPPFMQGVSCLAGFVKGGGRCSGCLCVQLNKIIPFAINYIPQCSNLDHMIPTSGIV